MAALPDELPLAPFLGVAFSAAIAAAEELLLPPNAADAELVSRDGERKAAQVDVQGTPPKEEEEEDTNRDDAVLEEDEEAPL